MNIGIDIGACKTVIYSTAENGTVVTDEFDKREIPTVMEMTSPMRSFGKSVSGNSHKNYINRYRGFFSKILDPAAQQTLFMYMEYLARTIKVNYKNAALCVPEYFTQQELRVLKTLTDSSSLRVEYFQTHLTSIAASAALRKSEIPETFMVMDFGSTKTSIGIFEYKDSKLTPKSRYTLKRGAADFDEVIYKICIEKYNLPDDSITREKLFHEVGKIKRGLNTLDSVKASIFSETFETIPMEVHRSDFIERVQGIVEEIEQFVKNVFETTKFDGYIEVVGNNYNSALIQKILEPYRYMTTLNPSESAALGCCLGFAVNSRKMKHRVDEIVGKEISLRVQGESTTPVVVFSNGSLTEFVMNVKYSRTESFAVEVLEGEELIGLIHVEKEKTEKPEIVKIGVKVNKFMLVEVVRAIIKAEEGSTEDKNLKFSYETFSLPEETIEAIRQKERECRLVESEYLKTGELRNSTEAFLDSLDSVLDKLFPGLLSSEDKDKIDDVRDSFFDTTASTFDVETERRKKVFSDLAFLNEKLKPVEERIRNEAQELLDSIKPYLTHSLPDNLSKFAPNFKVLEWSIRTFVNNLKFDLENAVKYDGRVLKNLKDEAENYFNRYNELMIEAVKAEQQKQAATEKKDCCADEKCCGGRECEDVGCCGGEAQGDCCGQNEHQENNVDDHCGCSESGGCCDENRNSEGANTKSNQ